MVPNGTFMPRAQISPYINQVSPSGFDATLSHWINYLTTLAKLSQNLAATSPKFENQLNSSPSFFSDQPAGASINLSPLRPISSSGTRCEICNQDFKNSRGLKQHNGKMHEKEGKKATCSVCFKIFKNKYALKSHISQVHEQVTKVECPVCHKMIYNKYVLSKHIESRHSN
jgi:hypothetical protein